MAKTYTYPGVYVEDVLPLFRPIAGVSTSTAGFIGISADLSGDNKMPENPNAKVKADAFYKQYDAKTPKLLTSWNDFQQFFGLVCAENKLLALAVYGFFENGGARCYVARIQAYKPEDFQACLDAFAAIDEISIVAAPGVSAAGGSSNTPPPTPTPTPTPTAGTGTTPTPSEVHSKLISHCTTLENRIAILDCDNDMDPTADTTTIEKSLPSDELGYSAFYCPWIKVSDPMTPGEKVFVPPSGAIAGIYARTDSERGVHKAPANELVRGAFDLNSKISKVTQQGLNPIGVNCIRDFYGSIRVWGARTLAVNGKKPDSKAWKYVSVRRFMIYLKESIEKDLQWVVFEPNDLGLWQRITRTVSDFLLAEWRSGALFGETPKQAFYVRCDASTNTPDLRESGQVVTEIGVAVVKPAEFVIFRIQQQTGG